MNKSKILFPIVICCALSPKAINSYEFKSDLGKLMNETIPPIVLGAACGLASSKLEARKEGVEEILVSDTIPIMLDVGAVSTSWTVLLLISKGKEDLSFSLPKVCFVAAYFFARVYALPVK